MPRVGQASRLSREERQAGSLSHFAVRSRVLAAQTNGSLRPARDADRIRLTALPKSTNPTGCESAHLSAPVCSNPGFTSAEASLAPQLRLAEALGWINLTRCTEPVGI